MKHSHISSGLVTISLIGLCLLACGPKQQTDQDKVASLPDLPQADVDQLKPVPNTHFLATSQVQRPSTPSPVTGASTTLPGRFDGNRLHRAGFVSHYNVQCPRSNG